MSEDKPKIDDRHRVAIGARRCGHCQTIGHNRRKCPRLRECANVHADGRVCVLLAGHPARCASIDGKYLVRWSDPRPADVGVFVGAEI